MATKPKRVPDDKRTALLRLDELFVVRGKGDQNNFFAWSHDPDVERCPLCGGTALKIQNLFTKTYTDLLDEDGRPRLIKLTYEFYKFRCLNETCRHIFSKEIDFAQKNDNVTKRLENTIAQKVLRGDSYGYIALQFQESVTRQAVGQIFHRWVARKEGLRKINYTPSSLAILTGELSNERYTLFVSLDNGINVLEIQLGVKSANIGAFLQKLKPASIHTVFSECDPTINDAITDYLPQAKHVIPIKTWFRLVLKDYKEFAFRKIKWSSVGKKDEVITTPRSRLGLRIGNLTQLLSERPEVRPAYEDYDRLCNLLERRDERWVFDELLDWADSITSELKEQLALPIYLLEAYRKEIEIQTWERDIVPEQLVDLAERLEEELASAKTFSEDVLKARALYAVESDLQDWRGIPIQTVIETLNKMELYTNRKRRDPYEYQ